MDACDEIMDHIHKPKGLIRYASENGIALKQKMTYTWRLKLYTLVLSLLLIFLAVLLMTRADVAARMMRTSGQTYQLLTGHKISNLYNIKLVNKTRKNIHLDLKLENIEGEIKLIGVVDVPKESYFQTSFFIILKNEQLKARKTKVKVGIYENGKRMDVLTAIFLGPSV
jgi:polyferredoxin